MYQPKWKLFLLLLLLTQACHLPLVCRGLQTDLNNGKNQSQYAFSPADALDSKILTKLGEVCSDAIKAMPEVGERLLQQSAQLMNETYSMAKVAAAWFTENAGGLALTAKENLMQAINNCPATMAKIVGGTESSHTTWSTAFDWVRNKASLLSSQLASSVKSLYGGFMGRPKSFHTAWSTAIDWLWNEASLSPMKCYKSYHSASSTASDWLWYEASLSSMECPKCYHTTRSTPFDWLWNKASLLSSQLASIFRPKPRHNTLYTVVDWMRNKVASLSPSQWA